MGNASNVQTNFLGGEWSKAAQGRADKPEYKTALARALNIIPVPPGAAPRRPGFRHVAVTRDGGQARLIDYTFQESAPYIMEVTDGIIRFFSGTTAVRTNDDVAVSAISASSPAEVTTVAAHGWDETTRVRFFDLGINNPLLQNREFVATITSTTAFTLTDPLTGDAIDGSTLGTFVSGTVGRVLELTSPYAALQLDAIRKAQINQDFDTDIVLFHSEVKPQILTVEEEPTDDTFAEFSLAPSNFEDGPYLDPFKNSQVTPSGTAGIISLTFDFKAWSSDTAYSEGDYTSTGGVTYRSLINENQNNAPASVTDAWEIADATALINGGEGFKAGDIGRHIRIYSEPPIWSSATTYALNNVVSHGDVTYTSLANSNINFDPETQPTKWAINPSGAIWTWGKITSVSGGISTEISQSLGTTIGDFSNSSSAFDGSLTTRASRSTSYGYIGKNFSGAPQAISSATVIARASEKLWANNKGLNGTLNLRASQTAPASRSDGTLLGTSGLVANPTTLTVVSVDQTTEWEYIWLESITSGSRDGVSPAAHYFGEIQFFQQQEGGTGCFIQVLGDPLLYTTAARKWRLGLYSDTTGWPRCGVGHEGRLWLSGGAKNRFDASRSNKPFNFAPTEKDGTVVGSNAFDYTFNADQANTIYWMHSERQGVLCGTDGGEWLVQASSNSNPLTPTSVQANKSTRIKCADAEPASTGNSLVIIQRYRRKLVEYFADVNAGKFTAPDLSEYSKHMLKDSAAQVIYQRELAPIVWCRTGAGELRGMTYKRESLISSAPPEFYGWHQHTLGSGRTITSMCVGPSVDEATDTLSVVTYDAVSGLYHVEMLTEIVTDDLEIEDSWYLDNAIAPSSYVPAPSTLTLYGLWHLNGATVTVLAGGVEFAGETVSNGSIVLTITEPQLRYIQGFGGQMPIVVGFPYTSQGQTVRPVSMADTGAQAGPAFGKQKRNHQYAALLESAQDISFGSTFSNLKPAKLISDGGTPLSALQLKSGVHTEPLEGSAGLDGMICWECSGPFPATVVMLGGFISTADK